MSITLSPGQDHAFQNIAIWYHGSYTQEFCLAGYAGTGKSTLANLINEEAGGQAKFCAFTGKAANVLREKGCDASTLHSALYTRVDDERISDLEHEIQVCKMMLKFERMEKLIKQLAEVRLESDSNGWELNPETPLRDAFVIVDEYSMLPDALINDLRSVARKILYLGDPFQLPPVNGTCNLKPDAFLEEIHRQALDSPIIRYSTAVRTGESIPYCDELGFKHQPKSKIDAQAYLMAEQIIVGRNATRSSWNRRFRTRNGHEKELLPQAGEKIICLKNNPKIDLFNGMICYAGKSDYIDRHHYTLDAVDGENEMYGLNVWLGDIDGRQEAYDWRRNRKLERFDFAYAITCHKAQGSEFKDVLIYNEPVGSNAEMCRRWLYTAITRAREKVILVDPS